MLPNAQNPSDTAGGGGHLLLGQQLPERALMTRGR
jgi:hypothetical protein